MARVSDRSTGAGGRTDADDVAVAPVSFKKSKLIGEERSYSCAGVRGPVPDSPRVILEAEPNPNMSVRGDGL